jgi:class 3 adenylate cyclase
MICDACGCPNADGRRFCGLCGLALSSSCTACGATNGGGERFCAQCGKPLQGLSAAPAQGGATPIGAPANTTVERQDPDGCAAPGGASDVRSTEIEGPPQKTERSRVIAANNRDSPEPASDEILRREGDFWSVSYQGRAFRLKHSKGLQYIAYLMCYPDRDFHSVELISLGNGVNISASIQAGDAALGHVRFGVGSGGEMLDEKAKSAYRERLSQLREELEEAKSRADFESATKAEDEIEALGHELSRAISRGGRDRQAVSDVERARLNTTRAIKAAIEKIAKNEPSLGKFFSAHIRTGTFCCYDTKHGRPEERHQAFPSIAKEGGSIEAVATAAAAEPAGALLAQASPDGTVTILFSDIENSSALVERLGDLGAHDILKIHNQIVREQVAAHQGFEVKSMGDGFMIAFSGARRGLLCAIAIQRALAASREAAEAVRVRIGLHVGETIKQSDDFFGKTVILAARIAGLARGGEILVSSTFHDLTESAGDLSFEAVGEVELKGLSGKHPLFRALW